MHAIVITGYDEVPPVRIAYTASGKYRIVWRTMFNGAHYIPLVNDKTPNIDTLMPFITIDADGEKRTFFSSFRLGLGLGVPICLTEDSYLKWEMELLVLLEQQMNP